MISNDLKRLLANKHTKDIVVHECPISTAYSTGYGQIDTWVLKPSWANPVIWGYEIKVSRQDFLNDSKWTKYLPYCNEFYFVVPPGIADVSEIPENAGLMVAAKTGTMLFKKKKAPYREIERQDMAEVFQAVLMNRARIMPAGQRYGDLTRDERIEKWRSTVKTGQDVGWMVGEKIQDELREMRRKLNEAARTVENVESFKTRLRSHGIDPDANFWEVGTHIDTKFKDTALADIRRIHAELGRLIQVNP